MQQTLEQTHKHDENGKPAGGFTSGTGISITWQDGPIPHGGKQNGAQVDDVIAAAIGRLQWLQAQVPCRENALAVTKLEEALHWLEARTANRKARGVEGTHNP